jgi:Fe-S cluster assembly iron-binding protein IscA
MPSNDFQMKADSNSLDKINKLEVKFKNKEQDKNFHFTTPIQNL